MLQSGTTDLHSYTYDELRQREQDIADYTTQILYSKRYSDEEFEYRFEILRSRPLILFSFM